MRATIPPGASILAEPTYWLALRDHPYYNWWNVSWFWLRDGQRPAATLTKYRFQVVIVDRPVESYFEPSRVLGEFWQPIMETVYHPSPLPGTLEEALDDHYRLAYQGFSPAYGNLRIYLLRDG